MEWTIDLASCLGEIPDRPRAEGKMYGQVGVILFSIIAMLSGTRSYQQIRRECAASCSGSIRPNWSGLSAIRKGSIDPVPLPVSVHRDRREGVAAASTSLRIARRRMSSAESVSTRASWGDYGVRRSTSPAPTAQPISATPYGPPLSTPPSALIHGSVTSVR